MARFGVYQGAMSEQPTLEQPAPEQPTPPDRIHELEQQLLAANEAVAKLTLANAELTRQLSEAESHRLKMKRSAKRDESSFREQLSVAQSRRF
jgi:F0F1-type ATP synthase membrane subunit b/b'